MFDFNNITYNIKTIDKINFDKYIESIYLELNNFLVDLNNDELQNIKYDIEDLFYDLISHNLISKENSTIINSFLILIAEQFEKLYLTGAIVEIVQYLPKSSIKQRLEASILYLRVNDLTTQYHNNFDKILTLISKSDETEEYRYKSLNAIINFYTSALGQFSRVKNHILAKSFSKLFVDNQHRYSLLKDPQIQDIVSELLSENYSSKINSIKQSIDFSKPKIILCNTKTNIIQKEQSDYSQKLYNLNNLTFNTIRDIACKHIQSIGDPQELYDNLARGEAVIDDKNLLYKYLVSFGAKHKAKLYSAFDQIINNLNNQKLNIIDWGCGQAFATMVLIEYMKERKMNLDICNIKLIEPSLLALNRGLLHIDALKEKDYNIEAINSDINCLRKNNITFDNEHTTLHLFSNILDLESFKLDNNFLQNISSNIQSDNIFICVSPNINDKRNSRLDLFYNYFNENFNTELISSRNSDVSGHKRYEKVFKVQYIEASEVLEVRDNITKSSNRIEDYHVNIYEKLEEYTSIISPILDPKRLEENIELDPDYVIFKIRKVTEVITSHIYGQYEDNESRISQNDKIRYLSFDKKLLSRKAQSHLHTIRTIGNISAHEHIDNPSKLLKEDAYFLTTALVLLIEDLVNLNILEIE